MNNQLANLVVKIGADFSELETALGRLGNRINPALQRTATLFTHAGRTLTAGLTLPIMGLGAASVKASVDFESAFAGVRKSVEATDSQFAEMKQGIRDMAKEMPASAAEIAKVAGEAGQLGIAGEDLLKFTEIAVKLGETTNLSASEAAKGLARLANIMQLPTSAAGHLADVLVHLGNKGASTEEEIMAMALRIAAAGKTIGLSADEVMAWSNALSSVGIRAEMGGSAISRTFVDVAEAVAGLKPSDEQLQKLADSTKDVESASYDLSQAQRGVRDASEGVTEAQRGVRDAQENLASAQRSSRNAAESLRDAYSNLARAQRDQRQASLDSRRETLSVMEAQLGLNEVMSQQGNHALEVRDAQLSLAQAQKDLKEASKESGLSQAQAALRVQQAQQRLNQVLVQGPRHSLDLRNAQLRLEEAQNRVGTAAQRQRDNLVSAQKDITQASQQLKDARLAERNAAEGVAGAQRGLRNSYEGVSDAQRQVVEATDKQAEAERALALVTVQTYGKLQTFADVAGMTRDEFSELFKADPSAAMLKFLQGLDGITKSGGNTFAILEKLGMTELRQRDTILRMANANEVLRKSINDAADAGGRADAEYKKRAETSAARFEMVKNRIVDVFITLGDVLTPMVLRALEAAEPLFVAFEKIANAFAKLPKPVQDLIIVLAILVAAIGPVLMAIGFMLPGLIALKLLLPVVAAAFMLLTGPIGLIVLGILAAVAAGYLLYKNWDKVKASADAFGRVVTEAFGGILDWLERNWQNIAMIIGGPFVALALKAADLFGFKSAVIGALSATWNAIKAFYEKLKKIKVSINKSGPGGVIPSGFSVSGLATGTANVPQDMLAFIHKGEAVIPRTFADDMRAGKFMPSQGGDGSGSGGLVVSGPVRVINVGARKDVRGAMGDLAFGYATSMQRRGIWSSTGR